MQQSRLAATVTRSLRSLSLAPNNHARLRGYAVEPTGRPADPEVYSKERDRDVQPAVPSSMPEETSKQREPDTAKPKAEAETEYKPSKGTEPLTPLKTPHVSSPRLETAGVIDLAEPHIQQKRANSTSAEVLEEVDCTGLDGTPLPKERKSSKEQVEDDNEYYRHHKASPLSEIEVVDTRKPITRATDSMADAAADEYGLGRDIIGWRPEQLDTAEEALERARRIWRENAMLGDPDTPHGRVLRVLRGEWF